MLKVLTESGTAYYFVRADGFRVFRVGGGSLRRDGAWLRVKDLPDIEVGEPMRMMLEPLGEGDFTLRVTSPIVSYKAVIDVETKSSGFCKTHDWSWDDDDIGCPVCYGIRLEQERIIALLEADKATCPMKNGCPACEHLSRSIIAIKGED